MPRKPLKSFFIFVLFAYISLPTNAEEYQILIHKNDKELILKKSNEIIKKYHVATGKGGKGTKRKRGDNKTPLGVYRISKLSKSNRFHYFIQLDYPNLIDAWYGFKNDITTGTKQIKTREEYKKYFILKPDNQITAKPPTAISTAVPKSG